MFRQNLRSRRQLLPMVAVAFFAFCEPARAETLELMCDFDTILNRYGPDQPNGDHDAFYVSVDQDKSAVFYHWGDRSIFGPFPGAVSETNISWRVPTGSDGFGAIGKIDRMSGHIVFTTTRNEEGAGGFSGKCRPRPMTKKF